MTEISDRWRAKLKSLNEAPASSERSPYEEVLRKFVKTLNEADLPLLASLEEGPVPQRCSIRVRPRYRMQPSVRLLNLWMDGTKLLILGENQREIRSVEALETFLDKFIDESAFPDTIQEFREIEHEPVQGYLRTVAFDEIAPNDVALKISPDAQKQLATAHPGEKVTIVVKHERFPGAGAYDPNGKYVALWSDGYALGEIRVVKEGADQLQVTGTVLDVSAIEGEAA